MNDRTIARLQVPFVIRSQSSSSSSSSPSVRRTGLWSPASAVGSSSSRVDLQPSGPPASSWGLHHLPPCSSLSAASSPNPLADSYADRVNRTPSHEGYLSDGCDSHSILKKHHQHQQQQQQQQHGRYSTDDDDDDAGVRGSQRSRERRVAFKDSVSVYRYESDSESATSPPIERLKDHRFTLDLNNDHRSKRFVTGNGILPRIEDTTDRGRDSDRDTDRDRDTGRGRGKDRDTDRDTDRGTDRGTDGHLVPPDWTMTSRDKDGGACNRSPGSAVLTLRPLTSNTPAANSHRTPDWTFPACGPRFRFETDPVTHRRTLVIAVQLDTTLQPHEVLVKANKNGNKVRIVVSRRSSGVRNGTGRSDADDHIPLPAEVDPYQLKARLGRGGILHIDAPLLV